MSHCCAGASKADKQAALTAEKGANMVASEGVPANGKGLMHGTAATPSTEMTPRPQATV